LKINIYCFFVEYSAGTAFPFGVEGCFNFSFFSRGDSVFGIVCNGACASGGNLADVDFAFSGVFEAKYVFYFYAFFYSAKPLNCTSPKTVSAWFCGLSEVAVLADSIVLSADSLLDWLVDSSFVSLQEESSNNGRTQRIFGKRIIQKYVG